MDKRTALPHGYVLDFPGMSCVIEEEAGRGSNAIVYNGWYVDASSDSGERHHVLIKELFPYHEEHAIYRESDGTIACSAEGVQTLEFHRKSFRDGNSIHLSLRALHPDETSGNINTHLYHGTYYTILDYSGGRTLEKDEQTSGRTTSLRRITQRCMGLLESLRMFHATGCLHLDISPDNILLLNHGRKERVELIDYNSVVRIAEAEENTSFYFRSKQGFNSPEIRACNLRNVGLWTDLYSVTAVFYYCLVGRSLSRMQLCGLSPISVAEAPCLREMPETVLLMVRKILAKGLMTCTKYRYQTVDDMLADFQELVNRIEGIGVTHWALWETGSKCIRQELQSNPIFSYLMDEDTRYPLEISAPENRGMRDFLTGTQNVLLTGNGGSGKTTVLLQTAWEESQHYHVDRAVVLYLPLYDYTEGNDHFLHDKILQKMRFHPETETYANARHTLDLLLQKPLQTHHGECPVVCLLLDGYNEISGDTRTLQNEIYRFSKMEGVNVLLTSRYMLTEYSFEHWSMEPLRNGTVTEVLAKNGLLLPESPKMRLLLTNAMMLSLFVRTCLREEKQLILETREDLIYAYRNALLAKEQRSLPEDSGERWQLDAAIYCILPVVATLEEQRKTNNEELLHWIELLYAQLGTRTMRCLFPRWVGHTTEVRGDAHTGEEWYHYLLHDILWRRLGVVILDENGAYRIFHQDFRDVLAKEGKQILEVIRRKKRTQYGMVGGVGMLLLSLCLSVLLGQIPSYDPQAAIDMLGYVQVVTLRLEKELRIIQDLLDATCAQEEGTVAEEEFANARKQGRFIAYPTYMDSMVEGDVVREYRELLESLCEDGERFPWNAQGFDTENFLDEVALWQTVQTRYREYIDVLETVYRYGTTEEYRYFCEQIRKISDADLQCVAAYYKLVYEPCLSGMADWESTPEGREYAGISKRLADGWGKNSSVLMLADALGKSTPEDWRNVLSEAEALSYEKRSLLAQDAVYVRYLHRDTLG